MRAYAIGDIHGHLALLEAAHERIAADRRATGDAAAPVIHLGDLVDRGPDSRGVIAFLSDGLAAGAPWIVLRGNHDRMFLDFLDDPWASDVGSRAVHGWLGPNSGGGPTLESYGVAAPTGREPMAVHREAVATVPEAHRDFLAARPTLHHHGEAVFVHAGIYPGLPLRGQAEEDLIWIREPFLSHRGDHGFLVVHGHTVIDAPTHYGNRVNLDSGAAYGGPLTAAVIEGRDVWALGPRGREALRRGRL